MTLNLKEIKTKKNLLIAYSDSKYQLKFSQDNLFINRNIEEL